VIIGPQEHLAQSFACSSRRSHRYVDCHSRLYRVGATSMCSLYWYHTVWMCKCLCSATVSDPLYHASYLVTTAKLNLLNVTSSHDIFIHQLSVIQVQLVEQRNLQRHQCMATFTACTYCGCFLSVWVHYYVERLSSHQECNEHNPQVFACIPTYTFL